MLIRILPRHTTQSTAIAVTDIRLSVRLSQTCLVLVSKRAKASTYFFLGLVDQHSSSLSQGHSQRRRRQFSANICRHMLETVWTGPGLLWNTNRKSQVSDRSVSVPMTFSDLERRNASGQFVRRISVRAIWPRTTVFCMVTQVGRGVFLLDRPRPHPK